MYQDDDRDTNILKAVLPLMSRHAAGYHPISYAVWYEHAKGTNPPLHQDIEAELERQERLTVARTNALYAKHLIEPAEQALMTTRAGLQSLIGKIKHAVLQVDQDTSGFDVRLNEFHRDLAAATTIEELGNQVSSILAETHRVNEGFGKLTTQLDRGEDEVRRLTDELYRLREDALTDALTGLLNRRGFDRELLRLAPSDGAGDGALTVIMFDIDHFKKINDTYGHPLGDVVIAAVGRSIRECLGAAGVGARYGGEEFVILLSGKPIAIAENLAHSVRQRVEQGKIRRRQTDDPIAGVTISAGVATWHSKDDLNSLIERADRALYASKRAGRNCVTVFNSQDESER